MDWRVAVAETLTGNIVADVTPSSFPTFERKISDKGSLSVPVFVDNKQNKATDLHAYTEAGRYSWLLAYGSTIVQAGPVASYTYTDSTGVLSVSCSNLFSLFSRRVTRNAGGHTAIVDPSNDLTYANMTLRGILAQLVSDNMAQQYFALPVVLADVGEPGSVSTTYFGYDLKWISDNITDLTTQTGGPEFDFAPEYVPGQNRIQWRLNVGAPLLGDQASTETWFYGGAVYAIDDDNNGSASPCTRAWTKGAGSQRALLTGFYEDNTAATQGYPPGDYVDTTHTSETVQTALDGYAQAAQQAYVQPFDTWTPYVRVDGRSPRTGVPTAPALGQWALGDEPLFTISGHRWITDGSYQRRIIGYQNQDAYAVKLEIAPSQTS